MSQEFINRIRIIRKIKAEIEKKGEVEKAFEKYVINLIEDNFQKGRIVNSIILDQKMRCKEVEEDNKKTSKEHYLATEVRYLCVGEGCSSNIAEDELQYSIFGVKDMHELGLLLEVPNYTKKCEPPKKLLDGFLEIYSTRTIGILNTTFIDINYPEGYL